MREPARARNAAIVAVLVALALVVVASWNVLFASSWIFDLARATSGLIQPTLVASALTAAVVGAMFRAAALAPADVGWDRTALRQALWLLPLAYGAVQLGLVTSAVLAGDPLRAGTAIRAPIGETIGTAISQLLGTALVEETVFRGFLLRQLALRMRLEVAVGAAAVAFALWHVPQQLALGLRGLDLAGGLTVVGLGGVVASYLYLRSRNLWLVVILHALFNDSAPLVVTPISPQLVVGGGVLAIGVWLEIRRSITSRSPPKASCA